jgi:hypothetical protein
LTKTFIESLCSGTLYDNVAGVPTTVSLQLRDYFNNKLITGGRYIELALLGVGGELVVILSV